MSTVYTPEQIELLEEMNLKAHQEFEEDLNETLLSMSEYIENAKDDGFTVVYDDQGEVDYIDW